MTTYTVIDVINNKTIDYARSELPPVGTILKFGENTYHVVEVLYVFDPPKFGSSSVENVIVKVLPGSEVYPC